MTPWYERWNIKHLSPSSINAWRDNPASFVVGWCFGMWSDEAMPAAWRGKACEGALNAFLHGAPKEEALQRAVDLFELEAKGVAEDDVQKQRDLLPRMCERAFIAAEEIGLTRPTASQLRLECFLENFEVPIIGYPDFIFDEHCLDLKSTERCPSEKPNAMHAMQVSLYAHARGESEAKLLYVSHTKYNLFTLNSEEISKNMRDLERLARSIRATLSRAYTKEELAEMCAPDFSHYRWSDEKLVSRVQSEIQAWS